MSRNNKLASPTYIGAPSESEDFASNTSDSTKPLYSSSTIHSYGKVNYQYVPLTNTGNEFPSTETVFSESIKKYPPNCRSLGINDDLDHLLNVSVIVKISPEKFRKIHEMLKSDDSVTQKMAIAALLKEEIIY